MIAFLNRYGHFSDDAREYVITRPDTPRPWINYLHNGSYVAIVSQTGGGFSFLTDAYYNRLTRWRWGVLPDRLPADEPGRYVYLKDEDTGSVWSATFMPVRRRPDFFECRHTPGLTTITSANEGIRTTIRYFVALDDAVEIWLVELKNQTRRRRMVSTYPYVEWCLGRAAMDRETYSGLLFNRVRKEGDLILATKALPRLLAVPENPMGIEERPTWYHGFVASSLPLKEFELDRLTFLGRGRWGDRPRGVERGPLSCLPEVIGRDACAVFRNRHRLAPGGRRTFAVVLGVTDRRRDAGRTAGKYVTVAKARREMRRVQSHWARALDGLLVRTPDPAMDVLTNVWFKHQALTCACVNRAVNYYHCGFSVSGFRDTCQDLLARIPEDAGSVRQGLCKLCYCQFRSGDVVHYRRPYTFEGDWTGHVDSLLWFALTLGELVKETGDWTILDEEAPYKDGGSGSLLDHAVRTFEYTFRENMGPRGIPLIRNGDWNDALNSAGDRGKGESFWMAPFLYHAVSNFMPILERRRPKSAAAYARRLSDLKRAFNRLAWDGEWFRRATTDDGRILGSRRRREGRIFLMPQAWAVLSGITTPDRERRALAAVRRHLYTEKGPVNVHPPYRKLDYEGIGILTSFPPNMKENGSVFLHAAAWLMAALCKRGQGDEAYQMYTQLSPIANSAQPDLYLAEPYVTAEILFGPGCPPPYRFGEGSQTWLTGSGAWLWIVATAWILGVRAEWDGLRIDPCIPRDWPGFRMTRPYRGNTYEIAVTNPCGVSKGVASLEVDGRRLKGSLIRPVRARGRTVRVKAVMGESP